MFDLGMKLKELRKNKKMTQKKLADILNVSEASISKYEGNLAVPPIDTLKAYSAFFKISLDELLGNQKKEVISLYGLTQEQTYVVRELTETFRNCNADAFRDDLYAVIGKIAMELYKTNIYQ